MHSSNRLLVACVYVLALCSGVRAQVPNDECAGAAPLFLGPAFGTNVGSTTSQPPWSCSGGSNDVWFQYYGACRGVTVFDTCSWSFPSFETVVEVFDGTLGPCGALVAASCSTPIFAGCSAVSVATVPGVPYYIRVGGVGGATGNFSLTASCQGIGPDECAGATPIGLGTTKASLAAYTASPEAWPCVANGGPDRWFVFTAGWTGTHTFSTCSGTNFDSYLQLFAGSACGQLASIACDDNTCGFYAEVSAQLVSGQSYWVRVGGPPVAAQFGIFELTVRIGGSVGSMTLTQPSNCSGPQLALALTGGPGIGGTVTSNLSGAQGGVPFHAWGFGAPTQPLAPQCLCHVLTAGAVWQFGYGGQLVIPSDPSMAGVTVQVQGAELLAPTGSCNFPLSSAFTDVWTVNIQ